MESARLRKEIAHHVHDITMQEMLRVVGMASFFPIKVSHEPLFSLKRVKGRMTQSCGHTSSVRPITGALDSRVPSGNGVPNFS